MVSTIIPVALLFTFLVLNITAQPVPCAIQGICYALDWSGSVSSSEYDSSRNFTVNSSRAFATPGVVTEYSAAGFSSTSAVIQTGTTDLEGLFVPVILNHTRGGGSTNIYRGVEECAGLIPSSGARVIVVVTDGNGAQDPNPVPALKNDGVVLVTIGVGGGVNVPFLENLATTPDLYFPATFDMLPTLANNVTLEACKNIPALACQEAFDKCEFTIANSLTIPTYNISNPPDVAIQPVTKKDGKALGVINAGNFESQFIDLNGTATNISSFGNQLFSPTTFKTEVIANFTPTTSGVAHERFQGNQFFVVDDQCVRMFINNYQLLLPNGQIAGNINIDTKSDEKCVVFTTVQ